MVLVKSVGLTIATFVSLVTFCDPRDTTPEYRMSIASKKALGVMIALCLCEIAHAQDAAYAAPATVLKDDITYNVAKDGTYTMDETVVMRVNTAQAVQSLGQSYLSYSSSLEDLQVLEAYTIDKDGKRIDVAKDKIVTQQSPVSTGAPSFGDVKVKAIVFPSIEPGATKAYHVLKTVKTPLFAGQFSMAEYFPSVYEFKEGSVTLVAPANLPMHVQAIDMQGGEAKPDKAGTKKWVWSAQDVKAELPEAGSVSPQDFGPRVAATTFADHADAARAYLNGSEPKAKVTPAIQKQADQITAGITDPRAKAIAVYNWVSHNIRYVALAFGQGGVVPHDAESILTAHYGDCKDHAVLLQALLAAEGISSSPVLVNSGSVYWHPEVAISPGVFDHCITYIPQFKLFVDSTAEIAPFGVLTPTEAGKMALVARGDDGKPAVMRLPLTNATSDTAKSTMTATLSTDGSVSGKTENAETGMLELVDRLVLSHVAAGQEPQVAAALMAQFGAPGTGTLALGDARDLAKPYAYTSNFTLPGYASVSGPGSFAFPIGIPGMSGIAGFPRETLLPTRKHPFTCIAAHKVESSSLTLPEAVKVKQLPPAAHIANAIGSYTATYSQSGQTITVNRELTLTPKNALCNSDDYQQMREIGSTIARDLRAQVTY